MPSDIRNFLSPSDKKPNLHNVSVSPSDSFQMLPRKRKVIESSPEMDSPKCVSKVAKIDERNNNNHNGNSGNNNHSNGGVPAAAESVGEKEAPPRAATAAVLDAREKERRLVQLKKRMPNVCDLEATEALSRCEWDVGVAEKSLTAHSSSNSSLLNSSGEIFDTVEDYQRFKGGGPKKADGGDDHQHRSKSKGTSSSSRSSSSSSHRKQHKEERSSSGSSSHNNNSSSSSNHHHKSPHKSSSSSSKHHHHSHHHKSHSSLSPSSTSSSSGHRSSSEHHHHHKGSSSSSNNNNNHSPSKRHSSDTTNSNHHQQQEQHEVEHRKSSQSKKAASATSKTKVLPEVESDEDILTKPTENVYDSDADSDDGMNFVMTQDRQMVLDFLNEATPLQLTSIKTCSLKKADALVELRPFNTWRTLVQKIQGCKSLGYDIMNHCQELLRRRQKMSILLKKCKKIIGNLERAIEHGKDDIVEQPKLLSADLKLADYQLIGLNWLIMMHKENFNGILADEMGLGKTVQVISFLAYIKAQGLAKAPHLIVVPSSTMDNWDHEMAKWCPTLKVVKYYGALDERKALRISFVRGGLDGVDVILTTYHTVASLPEERKMFRTIQLEYVIFDEAHMLKNMTTQRYEYLSRINAHRRILLTGTPLQNNLMELMSLLCFVMPKLFANCTEDFKMLFQKAGGKAQKVTAAAATDGGAGGGGGGGAVAGEVPAEVSSFEQTQIEQAKQVMKPFVLRRLKKDVLKCLPPKTTTVVKVRMSEGQRTKYTELIEYYANEAALAAADPNEASNQENNGMAIMMEMRKLTNHPLLMRYYFTDDKVREIAKRLATDMVYKKDNAQYIFEELAIMSDFQLYEMAQKYTSTKNYKIPKELIVDSGKFAELDGLLPQLKKDGHRVLIFSQFTMMLDILEKYLTLRKYGYLRLDGSTTVTERQDMIDEYNTEADKYFIFLLSTRAGGLGINLTTADTVIIHDIDFNPYNDKQAEDRCHRLGQTRPVHIYKFITEQSIEEGMFAATEEKLILEREVTNLDDTGGDVAGERKSMMKLLSATLKVAGKVGGGSDLSPAPVARKGGKHK